MSDTKWIQMAKRRTAVWMAALLLSAGTAGAAARGEGDTLRLFFVGDVMQHSGQIRGAWDAGKGEHDYMPCLQYIAPYWAAADVVVANLETTLAAEGFSGYPQFCAPWQLARDLKRAGVDIVTTNNNHSCDKGARGIRRTLHYLDSLGLAHTGTYADTAAWVRESPLYVERGGFKVAFLSYTYGTNGIAPGKGQVVAMIDTVHMARQISKARLEGATHVAVCMHWGMEYATRQDAGQERLAAFLHGAGADIVIGSHPHVVQPLEYRVERGDTTGVTVYSLGNFVSNQSQRHTNGGLGVEVTLVREGSRTRYAMRTLASYVYRPVEADGVRRYYVVPEPEAARVPEGREAALCREFFRDTDKILGGVAEKITKRRNVK